MDAQTAGGYRPWKMTGPLFSAQPSSSWVWESMLAITLVLVALNVLLVVLVHGRRIRQSVRRSRERRFQAQLDEVMAKLDHPPSLRDRLWLRWQLAGFDELQRPLAAVALIERLRPASAEERRETLTTLREVGAVELLVASTGSRIPWRRALAVRTLGWVGAEETVPVLIERARDRNRYVREAAVRALGRVREQQALPLLGELLRAPGRAAPGVVYDALISFGIAAAPTFAGALRSEFESVRVASCYGVAAVSEPTQAAAELEPLLADTEAPVRAAAAEALGRVGGGSLPAGLARASHDEVATVRVAATRALGVFDDPQAVELAVNALLDPDRDTAVSAGESLVRLARRPASAAAAEEALARSARSWPVERALVMDSVGAV
jgi:HEAT repeat protein